MTSTLAMDRSPRSMRSRRIGVIWARTVAVVVALVGLALLVGGVWLMSLGGSWYYALAGLGLLVAGIAMWDLRRVGFVLYVVVWLATLIWAFWEVGADPWALVPRTVAPTVLLLVLLTTLPFLKNSRTR